MRIPSGSSADLPGVPAPADISRRTFFGAASAAGIAAATARKAPAKAGGSGGSPPQASTAGGSAGSPPQASTAADSGGSPAGASAADTAPRCFFGSNADVFLDIKQGVWLPGLEYAGAVPPSVPGLTGIRIYGKKPDSNGNNRLRHQWPAGPSPIGQGPIVYSIYPMPDTVTDPDHPAYFATIRTIQNIIDTAPTSSYLTAWHEALSLPSSTPPGATPAIMKSLHTVLNGMCQKSANVTYGSIFGGSANFLVDQGMTPPAACPPRATVPLAWDSVPDDLGFYGVDVYGCDAIDTNMCFLETFITNANAKAADGYPKILIAETNNNDTDLKRVAWFERVAARMQAYGPNAIGILTFWGGADAELSGAWDPTDTTVIGGMNYVINSILV